jgi:HlyD family secretion protein
MPKRSLTGDSTERVDTRVLQVVYRFKPDRLPIHVGQQMEAEGEKKNSLAFRERRREDFLLLGESAA